MKGLPLLVVLVGAIMSASSAIAGNEALWEDRIELSGWADTIHSIRTHSPNDKLTSRMRLRTEVSADLDQVYGFLSLDAEKNWKIDSETGVDLQEVWFEHGSGIWDVRLGRQIIIWGNADGVQITDIISPPDYTESVSRDLDEIRMPVDAARLRIMGDLTDTEFIWIPVFQPAVLPKGDNPWNIRTALPDNIELHTEPISEPATSLENSEIAMKMSAFLSGLDIAASAFYTWDDYPAMHRVVTSKTPVTRIHYFPRHHRMFVFGMECSRPWSDFVFRGEAAYYNGKYHEMASILKNPIKKNSFKWLAGADWSPGNDWTVIAQITGATILEYENGLAEKEYSSMSTLNVSKKLLNQTLTLSNMLFYDLDKYDYMDRIKADYAVTDSFNLSAGADIFHGGDGQFGVYRDNSQIWIKGKYSF